MEYLQFQSPCLSDDAGFKVILAIAQFWIDGDISQCKPAPLSPGEVLFDNESIGQITARDAVMIALRKMNQVVAPQGSTILVNPPPLKLDRKRRDEVSPIERIERRVVWNLLLNLCHAGYSPRLVVCDEHREKCTDPLSAMEAAFNFDECEIHFAPLTGKRSRYWVKLVFGNEGNDVVSDYSPGDPNRSKWSQAMASFDADNYV